MIGMPDVILTSTIRNKSEYSIAPITQRKGHTDRNREWNKRNVVNNTFKIQSFGLILTIEYLQSINLTS